MEHQFTGPVQNPRSSIMKNPPSPEVTLCCNWDATVAELSGPGQVASATGFSSRSRSRKKENDDGANHGDTSAKDDRREFAGQPQNCPRVGLSVIILPIRTNPIMY
jgi:hypothetical protein